MRKFPLILLGFLTLSGSATSEVRVGSDGGLRSSQYSSDDAVAQALRSEDPLGDSAMPSPSAKGFRLNTGPWVHGSCLRDGVAGFNSPEALKERFEMLTSEAARSVLHCGGRYPELSAYFKQWISQFRRVTLVCTSSTSAELAAKVGKLGAWDSGTIFGFTALDSDTLKNTLVGREKSIVDFKVNPSQHQVAFVFSSDFLKAALGAGQMTLGTSETAKAGLETVVHEIFHMTSLNNRGDHNTLELVPVELEARCTENSLIDRVKTVSKMCLGQTIGSVSTKKAEVTQKSAQELYAERIASCGPKQGCTAIFGAGYNTVSWLDGWPTTDLDANSAKKLCSRIEQDGRCIRDRSTAKKQMGDKISDLERRGKLTQVSNRIALALNKKIPRNGRHLPNSLYPLFPAQMAKVSSALSDACVAKLLKRGDDGIYLTDFALRERLQDGSREAPGLSWKAYSSYARGPYLAFFGRTEFPNHFYWVAAVLEQKRPFLDPAGCGGSQWGRIQEVIDALREVQAIAANYARNPLVEMAIARASGREESPEAIVAFIEGGFSDKLNQAGELFGTPSFSQRLLDDYRDALRTGHPLSDQFACSYSSQSS